MKVLFDHQTFQLQTFGGISRYFAELLNTSAGFEADLALKRSSNIYLGPADPRWRGLGPGEDAFERLVGTLEFRGKHRLHRALRRLRLVDDPTRLNRRHSLAVIRRGNFDVLHPTYYDPYFLDVIGTKPFVITVFDMIHERFPEHFHSSDHTSPRKRVVCEHADRIIAISESTKDDLMRFFGILEERIDVIHLASSLGVGTPRPVEPVQTPERYLLYTGNRDRYKNFIFFLQAIAKMLHLDRGLSIVCTDPPFSRREIDAIGELELRDRVIQMSVDDAQLAELYRNAELLVYPSLYEGFGMPLVEAFTCGCPVAASDNRVFREIGGDAVAFFEPKDPGSIRDVVRTILQDRHLRGELVERGFERGGRFTWDRVREQTLRSYLRVRAGRGSSGPRHAQADPMETATLDGDD